MSLAGLLGNILDHHCENRENTTYTGTEQRNVQIPKVEQRRYIEQCPTPQLKLFSRKSYDSIGYEKKDIEQQTVSL
jgi:hypothetical protein